MSILNNVHGIYGALYVKIFLKLHKAAVKMYTCNIEAGSAI